MYVPHRVYGTGAAIVWAAEAGCRQSRTDGSRRLVTYLLARTSAA